MQTSPTPWTLDGYKTKINDWYIRERVLRSQGSWRVPNETIILRRALRAVGCLVNWHWKIFQQATLDSWTFFKSCELFILSLLILWRMAGGANYEFEGGTPIPKVGPRSQGWDPDHMGGTLLPRVWHCHKIILFRYKIQKKEKIKEGYAIQ